MLVGSPKSDPSVPEAVMSIAAGSQVRLVWENEVGGLTFGMESTQPHAL